MQAQSAVTRILTAGGSSQNRTKTWRITRESWSSPCSQACRWYHEDVSHGTEAHEVVTDHNIIVKTCLTFVMCSPGFHNKEKSTSLKRKKRKKKALPNPEHFPLTSVDDVKCCKPCHYFFPGVVDFDTNKTICVVGLCINLQPKVIIFAKHYTVQILLSQRSTVGPDSDMVGWLPY